MLQKGSGEGDVVMKRAAEGHGTRGVAEWGMMADIHLGCQLQEQSSY